jgi:hypothetical protein
MSLDTNVKILKSAYEQVNKWLKEAGLAVDVNVSKRELMHYSR